MIWRLEKLLESCFLLFKQLALSLKQDDLALFLKALVYRQSKSCRPLLNCAIKSTKDRSMTVASKIGSIYIHNTSCMSADTAHYSYLSAEAADCKLLIASIIVFGINELHRALNDL